MRTVNLAMRTTSNRCGCGVCGACLVGDDPCENKFFATQDFEGSYPRVIGTGTTLANASADYTSCISYQDAVNRALYTAMSQSLLRGVFGRSPNWNTWPQTRDSTEISATANCPCGWTGDPVTVTKAAGAYPDRWTITEANYDAYQDAIQEASDALVCTAPDL